MGALEDWVKECHGTGFRLLIDDFVSVARDALVHNRVTRRRLKRLFISGVVFSILAWTADHTVQQMVPADGTSAAKHWAREISSKAQPYKMPGILALAMWLAGSAGKRRRLRLTASAVVLSFTLAGLTTDVLKFLAGRARPEIGTGWHLLATAEEFQAFPSAHTSVAFATAVAVAEVYPVAGAILMVGAAATGWSRIFLMHHYFSDVVAGAYIGAMAGILLGAAAKAAGKEPPPSPGGSGPG